MKMRNSLKKHQGGLTLVELMVGIAIGAIISLAAYSQIATSTGKANVARATDDITAIAAGAVEWRSLRPNFAGISMAQLDGRGHVSDAIGNGAGTNPWGGNYTITVNAGNSGMFDIAITGVADAEGRASLEDKLDQASGDSAVTAGSTVTVTF